MGTHYLTEEDANDAHKLPNVWTQQFTGDELLEHLLQQAEWTGDTEEECREQAEQAEGTWMVCFCLPGCLPDSEWTGPFASEADAVEYMRGCYGDDY